MDYKVIIGSLLILYGIAKVGFSVVELTPNHESDKTFAGRFLLVTLLAFGIYSLLHGIGMVLHETTFGKFVHSTSTLGVVYMVFGMTLIELYALVAYTDLPISKDPAKLGKYKLIGIGGGILFLMSLVGKLLWDKFRGRQPPSILDYGVGALCFWFVILFSCLLTVMVESRSIFKGEGTKSELVSLAALLLNANVA